MKLLLENISILNVIKLTVIQCGYIVYDTLFILAVYLHIIYFDKQSNVQILDKCDN